MTAMVITKVQTENFETWKAAYDKGEGMRREHGARGIAVARDASNANLVTVLTRFESVDVAKKMLASDAWQNAIRNSKSPLIEASFVELVDERTY
jgi:hypothetical protein